MNKLRNRRDPLSPGKGDAGVRSALALGLALLALVLCLAWNPGPVQAAVVEGGSVERQVDTPTGVQTQTGLGEEVPSAPEPVETSSHRPDSPAQASPSSTQAGTVDSGVDPITASQPQRSSGGGSRFLGFAVVCLAVVAVGTFVVLLVARRGR